MSVTGAFGLTLVIVEVIAGVIVWGWLEENYKHHKRMWEASSGV